MTRRLFTVPLHIGDYLRDTQHLSTIEHGAYVLLLMHYYASGTLPTDEKSLQKICKVTPYLWRKILPNISALFQGGWKHKRVEFELLKHQNLAANGSKGGQQTAKRNSSHPPSPLSPGEREENLTSRFSSLSPKPSSKQNGPTNTLHLSDEEIEQWLKDHP